MCGILGIISQEPLNLDRVQKALQLISHRGPDDFGISNLNSKTNKFDHWALHNSNVVVRQKLPIVEKGLHATIAFAHARLSILDLSDAGHQPLESADGRFLLVYNGEIYNYRELNQKFALKCKSGCDTEVLLKMYERLGPECVHHFIGMWAFAVYDKENQSLFCSRDPFGIKPFYYLNDKKVFAFGSEIKALHGFTNINPNKRVLYNFLVYHIIDYSSETFFEGISQLEPGYNLFWNKNTFTLEKYFQLPSDSVSDSAELYNKFLLSLSLNIRSDVPIGLGLSGGIDSNIIAGTLLKEEPNVIFQTFSGIFKGYSEDESPYIENAIKKYGYKNTSTTVDLKYICSIIDRVIYHADEPIRTIGWVLPARVFEVASSAGIKVMLSGQGADEIFAGYGSHVYYYLLEFARDLKFGSLKKELKSFPQSFSEGLTKRLFWLYIKSLPRPRGFLLNRGINQLFRNKFFCQDFLKNSLDADFMMSKSRHPGSLHEKLLWDFTTTLRGYLTFEDRLSMMHSIESRVPFLNSDFVTFGMGLPTSQKIRNGIRKWVLREEFKDVIESSILDRKDKSGYWAPQAKWIFELKEEFLKLLLYPDSFVSTLITKTGLRTLAESVNRGPGNFDSSMAWGLISVELWHRQFFLGERFECPSP